MGSCHVLAGSWLGQPVPSTALHCDPSSEQPRKQEQLCVLLKAGQELGCPRAGTISPYWASPLVHFDCVSWIKWAIRR